MNQKKHRTYEDKVLREEIIRRERVNYKLESDNSSLKNPLIGVWTQESWFWFLVSCIRMLILRKNAFRYIFTYFYFMKGPEKSSLSLPPLPKNFSRPGKYNRVLKGPRVKTES